MGIQATVVLDDILEKGVEVSYDIVRQCVGETPDTYEPMYEVRRLPQMFIAGRTIRSYVEDVMFFDCKHINHDVLAALQEKGIPYNLS